MLVNMFQLAMDSLQNPSLEDPHSEPPSPVQEGDNMNAGQWSAMMESESTLASFIMMLDIIAKQVSDGCSRLFSIRRSRLGSCHKLYQGRGWKGKC